MRKLRMESLTDMVFGLALSLTALSLIIRSDETFQDVAYNLFWFAFNFIILISVWISYSEMLEHIHIETSAVLHLNVALLLLVSVEPYILNLMAFGAPGEWTGAFLDGTSALYGLVLGGIWLIMGALYHQAAKEGGGAAVRRRRDMRLLDAAIFFVSAVPVFWNIELLDVPLRFWIWFLSIPAGTMLSVVIKKRGER